MFEPGNYRRRKRMRRHAYKASGLAGFKSWPISAAAADHATTAAAAAAAAASQFIYGHRHPAYFHAAYPHISHPPPPPPPPPAPTQPPSWYANNILFKLKEN